MPKLETKADTTYQLQLPKVSFRIVDDEHATLAHKGVKSEQSRSYGYNDFSEFERPEHYIRYIEPIESELAVQVEYDMDEQDQEWLDSVNAERQKEQAGAISYEMFEIIMDKLEKEWFNLIKRIPQPASHLPVEDSKCSICDDGEGENSNAIVFCDGCNLAVHQDCYGVPYIPEGQWLCRKCTVSPENPVSCIFCPNEGGAFKQTTTGHWSHLLCAIWIPELTVGNAIYMEPVQDVEQLPKSRWKLNCSLCRERLGACIQCDNKTCFTAFHVTCARQAGLLMTMKTLGTEGILRAFCDKHLPAEMRDALDSESESEFEDAPKFHKKARRQSSGRKAAVTTKTARAHAKSYRPGPPIVPRLIVNSLLEYVSKVAIRKKQPFVERLCRYWSLKREARRGAPLLKRLHLEPWTASSTAKHQSEEEKAVKLKFLTMLRNDLDKVRMLAELTRKREKEKLRQAQVIKDIVDSFIFPHYGKLRLTLEKISAMDRQELFLHYVSRSEVPDYYQVIKEPMCWMAIDEKIERNAYRRVEEFKYDIELVLSNALKYNAPDTTFNRIAKRIQANSRGLLADLDSLGQISGDDQTEDPDVGSLEPSRILLEALVAEYDGISARDRLADLFAFELEPPKEPTPPPPSVPVKKREVYADRKKRWEEKEARRLERLATGRSTRAAQAVQEAFQHEAGLVPPVPAPSAEAGPSVPAATRRTRHSMAAPSSDSLTAEEPSSSSSLSRSRSQRGVVGREVVERISDRERRAREQNLDLVTEAVDKSDQFKRFNLGWVLPEGSKRTRHIEAPTPAPARARNKKVAETADMASEAGPSSSPLSSISVRESSLTPPSPDMPTPPTRRSGRGAAGVPSPLRQAVPRLSPALSRSNRKRPLSVDQPADLLPRPPKTARRSREESSGQVGVDEEIVVEDMVPGLDDEEMTPVPDTGSEIVLEAEEDEEEEEEKVEEAEVEYEEGEDEITAEASGSAEEEGHEAVDEDDKYPPGTLVWAKLPGYPYFPSEIVDPQETDIPPAVFRDEAKARAAAKGIKVYLVNFFDKLNTYGWIQENRLDMLAEDDALDQMYLALKEKGKSKAGKTKQAALVREGYRQALAQLEVEPED